jgi:hypothetical protein
MASERGEDWFSSHGGLEPGRYVTVIVRLLIDRRGKVLNGELATLDGGRISFFMGWSGLLRSLHAYLKGPALKAPDHDH